MSLRAAVAEGSRRRFAGKAAMGVGVVLVAGQIQLMARRARPHDGVRAAVPPGILFTFEEVKMLWRRLGQSDRPYQAEHQSACNGSGHVSPFAENHLPRRTAATPNHATATHSNERSSVGDGPWQRCCRGIDGIKHMPGLAGARIARR